MLGDTTIPWSKQLDWVWAQIARLHPEFKREHWAGHEDPYMLHEHVNNNTCGFTAWPGARVMDIGANIGVFTALCALNGARVIAYEPNRFAFRILLEQIRRIGIEERVTAINAPVWTRTKPVCFQEAKGYMPTATWDVLNGLVLTGAIGEREVFSDDGAFIKEFSADAVSFDDAVGNEEWDCVKMDIEGAEYPVLLAASDDAMRRVKFLTVELHPNWADKALYDRLIAKLERTHILAGVREGDPKFAGENRWQAIFATRKES